MPLHAKKRPVMLVSFSGIDGAGKSTQIENLHAHLEANGLKVQHITFWDDVARLKGIREGAGHKIFKGDKGVGSPDAPISRRDKNVRSPLMSLVRLALYAIDALSLRRIAKQVIQNGTADVIIFDRYLYDELANLNLKSAAMRLYIRLLLRLVPKPDSPFVLDADPVQAFARKPEYPLDFLHLNRNAYIELSELVGGVNIIPSLPLDEAKAEVVRRVFSMRLPASVPATPWIGLVNKA
jgi:thymidylate kinase